MRLCAASNGRTCLPMPPVLAGQGERPQFAIVLRFLLLAPFFASTPSLAQEAGAPLQKLAADFWAWRAKFAPFTGDDVNRLERPGGVRDWSAAAMAQRRRHLEQFETRWKQMDQGRWPIPQQVDHRLIGSALARVHWELEVNP